MASGMQHFIELNQRRNHSTEFRRFGGLCKVRLCAGLHCFKPVRFISGSRKEHDWCFVIYFTNRSCKLKTDTVRQPEIEKVEIKVLMVGQTNAILIRSSGDHIEFVFSQNDLYQFTSIFMVFDVEDPVFFELF